MLLAMSLTMNTVAAPTILGRSSVIRHSFMAHELVSPTEDEQHCRLPAPDRPLAAPRRYGRRRWNSGRSAAAAGTAAADPRLPFRPADRVRVAQAEQRVSVRPPS